MQAFQKRIGGVGLPKTYNVLGESIVDSTNAPGRLFNNLFNPFTVKKQKDDEVLKAFIKHEVNIPALQPVIKGVDLSQFINPKTGKTAFEEYNELVGKSGLRKDLERTIKSRRFKDAPDQITLDENNKFGGKKAIVYDRVKFYRDLEFNKIQFSQKYVSKLNPKITLGQAYINKDIIKRVGKATNKFPSGMKTGVYDFIDQTK